MAKSTSKNSSLMLTRNVGETYGDRNKIIINGPCIIELYKGNSNNQVRVLVRADQNTKIDRLELFTNNIGEDF